MALKRENLPSCLRFSLRDLLWMVLCTAILLGWHADRVRTAAKRPHAVVVDGSAHDWGTIQVGATKSHVFVIRNDGDELLLVDPAIKSMKLQVYDMGARVIYPGKTTRIEVIFDAHDYMQGLAVTQTLDVFTNDPTQPELRLTVKARIQ